MDEKYKKKPYRVTWDLGGGGTSSVMTLAIGPVGAIRNALPVMPTPVGGEMTVHVELHTMQAYNESILPRVEGVA